MDGIEAAVETWNTNIRLFVAADGEQPTEEAKRITLIHMLPMEVSAYISMHESNIEYKTFDALKRFIYKYVRTLRGLKRAGPRAAHLLDEGPPPLEVEEPDRDEEELMARLLATDDVEEQVEILAFMKQSGFRPPTRGQGGPRRFVPRAGAPARTGPAARFGAPPPRNRTDITCINCNRKGHTASECKQPRVEVKDRKCFLCNKTGHVARDCPDKNKAPLKAIEDAGTRQRPAIMMVQLAPPRPQGGQLADHIRAAPGRKNANRFQPLTMEKVDFWEDVAKKSSPPTAHQPLPAAPDFPPILKPHSRISPTAHFPRRG